MGPEPDEYPQYEVAFDLMESLLTMDFRKRPMARDALKHPFFAGMEEEIAV